MEAEAAVATQMIPTGYRFHPTDCEIISYLGILLGDDDDRAKEISKSLNGVFQWVDVYSIEPWDLFNMFYNHQIHIGNGGGKETDSSYLYCFSPLKKITEKGTNIDRKVIVKGSSVTVGTWKSQTQPINIIDSHGMPMGVKKQITFVPSTKMEDNEDDTIASTSSCSIKKRTKHTPEEMQGIRYIMHEYALNPYDEQPYSLCRIRKIIDKKKIITTNKKMRRSPSPTTTTSTVVQAVTNTAGTSEINIHPHVQISDDDKRSAQEIEEDLELPAEWWQKGATAEELGFYNIEELLRSCHSS